MRISWRNLFWKLLTFLISEIDAFSLSVKQRIYFDVLQKCVWNKVVFDGLYAKCRGVCGEGNRLMEVKYKKLSFSSYFLL